jgi:glycine cleavage system H lipoate-binding protein
LSGSDYRSFVSGLSIVPIDLNGNGRIDHIENYQNSYAELTRAVWIGKYPRELFNELRLVSSNAPTGKTSLDFIDWLLTSGQAQLTAGGFSELVSGELRSSLNHVYAADTEIIVEDQTYAKVGRAFIWILGVVVMILLSGIVVLLSSKKAVPQLKKERVAGILDNKKVVIPGGVLFDKSHTWSYMEKNGLVRVGAADFLQHITGKVSRIIPRNTGESIKRGEPMFTIVQDGKHLVLYSPVSGTIKNVNNNLTQNSSAINNSPYNEGWIYEVEPSKWMAEYRNFLMGDKYREWLSNEVVRLKEFLNFQFSRNHIPELKPVMQDGGEIADNILESMGPDIWEEFQLGFIDKAF